MARETNKWLSNQLSNLTKVSKEKEPGRKGEVVLQRAWLFIQSWLVMYLLETAIPEVIASLKPCHSNQSLSQELALQKEKSTVKAYATSGFTQDALAN